MPPRDPRSSCTPTVRTLTRPVPALAAHWSPASIAAVNRRMAASVSAGRQADAEGRRAHQRSSLGPINTAAAAGVVPASADRVADGVILEPTDAGGVRAAGPGAGDPSPRRRYRRWSDVEPSLRGCVEPHDRFPLRQI